MGVVLSTCTSDNTRPNSYNQSFSRKSRATSDKQEENIENASLQLSPSSHHTHAHPSYTNLTSLQITDVTSIQPLSVNSQSPTKAPSITELCDHLYLLTETGLLSTMKFIICQFPIVRNHLNVTRSITVDDFTSELSLIQVAVCLGQSDIVRYLLSLSEVQVQVSEPTQHMSLAHLAVYFEHIYCLQILVRDSRIDLQDRESTGKTALHLAIESGYAMGVECLVHLLSPTDYRLKDFDGNSMLHMAVRNPDEAIMKMMLGYLTDIAFPVNERMTDEQRLVILKRRKQFYEAHNFEGFTSMDILKLKMFSLQCSGNKTNNVQKESEQGSVKEEESPEGEEKEGGEEACEQDRAFSLASYQPEEYDEALAVYRSCFLMLQEASYIPAEIETSLSSLGTHSEPTPHPDQQAHEAKRESPGEQSSDESVSAAFSWSPANEMRMRCRIKALKEVRKQGGVTSARSSSELESSLSPLSLTID